MTTVTICSDFGAQKNSGKSDLLTQALGVECRGPSREDLGGAPYTIALGLKHPCGAGVG